MPWDRGNRSTVERGQRDSWNTPAEELIVVRHLLGRIDLDPCSNARSVVRARREVSLPDDGLAIPWRGRVFVNPPYSDPYRWCEKMNAEYRAGRVKQGLMLLPSDTSTRWFHEQIVRKASAICFTSGRILFHGDSRKVLSPPFGSLYAYWGRSLARFREIYGMRGTVILGAGTP